MHTIDLVTSRHDDYQEVEFFDLTMVDNSAPPAQNDLKVQYLTNMTNPVSNQISHTLNVVNTGTSAIPLEDVKIRYYFTCEDVYTQEWHIDYTAIGAQNISGQFVNTSGNNYYLELTFSSGAGSVAAGGDTGGIQIRFNKLNWTNYNQSDDYFFVPALSGFTDHDKLTLFRNDILEWGIEP